MKFVYGGEVVDKPLVFNHNYGMVNRKVSLYEIKMSEFEQEQINEDTKLEDADLDQLSGGNNPLYQGSGNNPIYAGNGAGGNSTSSETGTSNAGTNPLYKA